MATEVKFSAFAAYECKGELKPFEYVAQPLKDNDVQIKITHSGVCHSDIHQIDNDWHGTTYPIVPGHEIVGVVEAVGSKVTKHKVGDRVGVGAQRDSCHTCADCTDHDETMCSRAVYTYNSPDLEGQNTYGGYATGIRVNEDFAIAVPEAIGSAEAAPLLCAGVTVFAPLQRYRRSGDKIGVVGIGGLGHLAIQFAKALGHEVIAISTTADKEAEARSFGATGFLCSKDAEAMKKAARSLDFIVCAASGHFPLDMYMSLLRKDGRFCLLGIPEQPFQLHAGSVIFNRACVCGSLIGNPDELIAMMKVAAEHNVRPKIETLPLAEVNTAVNRVRSGPYPRYRCVLIV